MPLTSDWAAFFSAELAALAALTGFVVVAIPINLSRILAYPHLPTRAGEALIGPVGAIIATASCLPKGGARPLGSIALVAKVGQEIGDSCERPGLTVVAFGSASARERARRRRVEWRQSVSRAHHHEADGVGHRYAHIGQRG
jgi:hypothetical protein